MFLACALIALFFLFLWALSSTSGRKTVPPQPIAIATPTPLPVSTTTNSAEFFLNNFHRSEIRNGRKIWEIKAAKGQYYPEKKAAEITSADVWLFRENGEEIFLQAPLAEIGFDGTTLGNAHFPDTVHVVYNDNTVVDTSVATYDKAADTISSEHPVLIESDLLRIEGNSFIAHVAEKSMVISGGVTTVIKPRQKK